MSKTLVHIEKDDTVAVTIPKNNPETASHLTLHFGTTTVWIAPEDAEKLAENLLLSLAKITEARIRHRAAEMDLRAETLAAKMLRARQERQARAGQSRSPAAQERASRQE